MLTEPTAKDKYKFCINVIKGLELAIEMPLFLYVYSIVNYISA